MNQGWIKFSDGEQVPVFIKAIRHLYAEMTSRLTPGERPFFYDYWLKRLNLCESWLLNQDEQPVALAMIRRVEDIHFERWQYGSLAVDKNFRGDLELPMDMSKPRGFLTPATSYESVTAKSYTSAYFQRAYARTTEALPAPKTIDGIEFSPVRTADLEKATALFESGYSWEGQPTDYIASVKSEVRRAVKEGSGWCYMASRRGEPVAIASYMGLICPLLGVPAANVGDLMVAESARGLGIASNLQLYAYTQLKNAGLRWLLGQIDPANTASIRQAEKVGRTPLFNILILSPRT